jgi:hypothetical protein
MPLATSDNSSSNALLPIGELVGYTTITTAPISPTGQGAHHRNVQTVNGTANRACAMARVSGIQTGVAALNFCEATCECSATFHPVRQRDKRSNLARVVFSASYVLGE